MSDTPEEAEETFAMDVLEYPEGGGEVVLQQVALGMYPAIVLSPPREAGDNLTIQLSHITIEEAALLLGILSQALSENKPAEPADRNQS